MRLLPKWESEERLEVQAEKNPDSEKALHSCSRSSWFCFETVVELNLDEKYCT